MAIHDDDIARVRQASDIVEIVGGYSGLKKVGRRWTGLCPFHGEKTPSFSVNAEEGLYFCFGCGVKGDVITFVREIEHCSFVEAVEQLASRANIELRIDDSHQAGERKRRKKLTEALEKAVDWYHERLLSSPDAAPARSYLRDRGYDGELVRRFRIGWAPSGWDELARALKLPEQDLKDTGLGFVNRAGRQQDAFRERILFPIFDPSGAPVAFGGRILPGAGEPKYKNSSESPVYSKSRTLYGLNWAKNDVVSSSEVIVCEGYTDVIGFFQAGIPRAVATCGTALTEDHVRLMRNFASRVVLAYDADKAGQAAAERFYEWESKYDLEIVVAALPAGTDPADAARKNPQGLAKSVAEAKSFLAFRLDRILNAADLRSPENRAKTAQRCIAMIAEHPNELVRDQYVMTVADRCQLSPERLRESLRSPVTQHPAVVDVREKRRTNPGKMRTEWEALQVAIQKPEEASAVLSQIAPDGALDVLEDVLFTDNICQAAFRALVSSPTLHEAISSAEPEASDLLTRLAVEEEEGGVDAVFRLLDHAASREVRKLMSSARSGEVDWADVGPSIAWLKLEIERLRDTSTAVDAGAALASWLTERAPQPQ